MTGFEMVMVGRNSALSHASAAIQSTNNGKITRYRIGQFPPIH
jgi:hypothetical protein